MFIVLKKDGAVTQKHWDAVKRVFPNSQLFICREDVKTPEKQVKSYEEYLERIKDIK